MNNRIMQALKIVQEIENVVSQANKNSVDVNYYERVKCVTRVYCASIASSDADDLVKAVYGSKNL